MKNLLFDFAKTIKKAGFRSGPKGILGPDVYFAICIQHTKFKANHQGAYIYPRLSFGDVVTTTECLCQRSRWS